MKNIGFILAILFFATVGCEKQNTEDGKKLTVKNINFSQCGNIKKQSLSDILSIEAVDNNYLYVQHYKAEASCGDIEIDISANIKNDTIFIEEIDLGPYTYCTCIRDISFKVGPLKNKQYTLQLVGFQTDTTRDSVFINFEYSNKLNLTN